MNRESAAKLVERMSLIKAFAEGAQIQYALETGGVRNWTDTSSPTFLGSAQYRIKPIEHNWYVVYDSEGRAVGTPRRDRRLAESDLAVFEMRALPTGYHIKKFGEVVDGDKK